MEMNWEGIVSHERDGGNSCYFWTDMLFVGHLGPSSVCLGESVIVCFLTFCLVSIMNYFMLI